MIRKIEVAGKTYPVHYGMNVLAQYSEMRNVPIDDAINLNVKKMLLMDYLALIYLGLKDGARFEKQEFAFESIDEFLDFADENQEVITKVSDVFAEYGKESKEGKKK
jgi:hypothetical protein